jgi:hypothetical protein
LCAHTYAGGFFDGQSTDQDRREFLVGLLQEAASKEGSDGGGGGAQVAAEERCGSGSNASRGCAQVRAQWVLQQ